MSSDLKRSKSSGVKSEGMVKVEENGGGGGGRSAGAGTKGTAFSSTGGGGAGVASSSSSSAAAPRPSSPPPPTTYRDIPLLSTSLEDHKYHLMKLASFTKVDPSDTAQFPWPVKLNRKWPPKLKDELPMQGDPVLDQWGKPVMIPPKRDPTDPASVALSARGGLTTSESKKKVPLLWPGPDDDVYEVEELLARLETPKGPTADTSLIGPSNTANLATRAKAGLFQKRVREVYKSSSIARKTHNEEIQPWILEDYETSKLWESRKKESRRGMKALQLGIKARREGGRFPSQPNPALTAAASSTAESSTVKKEEILEEEEKKVMMNKVVAEKAKDNHAPWIGKLEGEAHESASTTAGGAMSHALFIFDERGAGGFRVVPVSRMYKFLQKPAHANNLSWEEAEKAFERHQKAQVGEGISKFLSRNTDSGRGGGGGSMSRVVRTKNEEDDRNYISSLTQSKGLQLPGSSRQGDSRLASLYDRDSSARRNNLMAVGGSSARGVRVKDEEGTYGELDFEEDFADDEERNEGDDYAMGEEETRELEQKIKREMARAEEEERDGEDEDDDLFDDRGRSRSRRGEDDVLTGSGKQMKKIMKALARREGNDVYDDDDDDRNPYASDNPSDDEEDTVMANPEEALRLVREEKEREAEEARKAAAKAGIKTEDTSNNPSRSGTPAPKADTGGLNTPTSSSRPGTATQQPQQQQQQHAQRKPGAGHATAAQRATSPNRRANSHSRQNSRSGSPVEGSAGTSSSSLKRKSEAAISNGKRPRTSTAQSSRPPSPGDPNSPRSASPSRHGRSSTTSSNAPLTELEMDIIKLVQMGKAKTTKELITHFNSWLKAANPAQRESFSKAVTKVLNTNKEKTLSVRPGLVD